MKTNHVKIGLVAAFFLITMTGAAWAGNGFHKRLNSQAGKIERGLRSGSLTYKEYLRLNKEQFRIQQARNRAWSDGRVTRNERRHIQRLQENAARHIYQANHNKYKQPYREKAYRANFNRHHPHKNTYAGCPTYPKYSRRSYSDNRNHDQWGFSLFLRDDRR